MKFDDFRKKTGKFPLINVQTLKLEDIFSHSLRVQLLRWQKRKKIIALRKNLYILNSEDRRINPSRLYISNQIYSPSYVSLEYALSIYGLIPEKVTDVTCITTKKTAEFENDLGRFVYQHIKVSCFAGFVEQKDEAHLPYFIAVPEKAVVDFIYLNLNRFQKNYGEVLTESFRFQSLESLKRSKLLYYAKLFKTRKLLAVIKELTSLLKE